MHHYPCSRRVPRARPMDFEYLRPAAAGTRGLTCAAILLAGLVMIFAGDTVVAQSHLASDASRETQAPTEDLSMEERILARVEQLNSPKFSDRERAMHELFASGLAVVPQLNQCIASGDHEVRQRARRILEEVARRDRPRRLAILISDQNDWAHVLASDAFGIPGLDRIMEIAGDSSDTRRMLAVALQSNWELVERAENGDPKLAQQIERYCRLARQQESATNARVQPGTIAAIMMSAMLRQQPLSDSIAIQVYSLLSQMDTSSTSFSVRGVPVWEHEPFRRLVGAFLLAADGPSSVYQGLKVAMEHQIPEGVESAVCVIRGGHSLPHIRQFAILALARTGDPAHIPDLETLLEDEAICFTRRQPGSRTRFECQVGDLALAAILHIRGEDPRAFGFRRIQTSEAYVFLPHTVGFDTEQDREAAQREFRSFANSRTPR